MTDLTTLKTESGWAQRMLNDAVRDRIESLAPQLAEAFNKWLDDYINHPEEFSQQWRDITNHLAEVAGGEPPTYGDQCVEALLRRIPTN